MKSKINDIKYILKSLEQLSQHYIIADENDDEVSIEELEEEFNNILTILKDNDILAQELLKYTDIKSISKLFRKLNLDSIASLLTFETQKWYIKAAEDKSLWNENIFTSDMRLIKHEYLRLQTLLKNGQIFGVLLEIKDIFELLLKLPVLLFASKFYNQKTRDINQNKILMQLIMKPISLGDWHSIANLIAKSKNIDSDDTILIILKTILKIYNKNNIVNWRNSVIGHGALMLETDKLFIKDLLMKIALLKEFFDVCQKELLLLKTDRKKAQLHSGKEVYELNPYIYFIDEKTYFFDTFYSKRKCAYGLNYICGDKQSEEILFNNLNNYYIQEEKSVLTISTDIDVESLGYKTKIIDIIDKITEIKEVIEPNHMQEWITGALKKFKKGVFLLEAEAGMGKSTFSKMLDSDSIDKIHFENLHTKAYYANDSYRQTLNSFVQDTRDNLRMIKGDKVTLSFDLSVDTITAESFAQYLNKIRAVFIDLTNNYDLEFLYIIDGLDEIPQPNREDRDIPTIFDVIPNSELLDDGIYILLTSRTKVETKEYTKGQLTKVSIDDIYTVTRKSEENISVLEKFAKKYIIQTQEYTKTELENFLIQLYKKADYRMLYMYMIKELLIIGNITIDKLPPSEELLDFYLRNLESKYGEKYFNHILKILIILATQYEELTTLEISYLFGEQGTSFKLLAFLLDLRGLLKSQRDPRGNKFSISHQDIKLKIREHTQKNDVLQDILNPLCSLLSNQDNIEIDFSDGESYILSHAIKYHLEIVGDPLKYNDKEIGSLSQYCKVADNFASSSLEYVKHRANSIYQSIIDIESALMQWMHQYDGYPSEIGMYNLAVIHARVSRNYFSMDKIADSYEHISKAISYLKSCTTPSYKKSYFSIKEEELQDIKEFFVHVSFRSGKFIEALEVADELISNHENLNKLQNPSRLYVNIAKIYQSKYQMQSAFDMYHKAKQFTKENVDKIHIDIEIAKTYRKNGDVSYSQKLLEEILSIDEIRDTKYEAEAKIQYGLCCFSNKEIEMAYQSYKEADDLLVTLDEKELLLYNRLGISTIYEYLSPPKVEEAKELLDNILKESKEYGFVNFYIDAMNGLSRKYILLQDFDKAIFYAKKGAFLWELQNATGGLLVMYSHILNALTGKYLIVTSESKEELIHEAQLYIDKGKALLNVVKEKVLLEIFKTSLKNWENKTVKEEGML